MEDLPREPRPTVLAFVRHERIAWGWGVLSHRADAARVTGETAPFTGSSRRSIPKLTNLTFRLAVVRIVSPVKPTFLRIAGLWCTENFPKLFSFSENPSSSR